MRKRTPAHAWLGHLRGPPTTLPDHFLASHALGLRLGLLSVPFGAVFTVPRAPAPVACVAIPLDAEHQTRQLILELHRSTYTLIFLNKYIRKCCRDLQKFETCSSL